jgi:hypothetical protein
MKRHFTIVFFFLLLCIGQAKAAIDSISVTVDTLCDGWHICVRHDGVARGVVAVYNLNDTMSRLYPQPEGGSPYISSNTQLYSNALVQLGDSIIFAQKVRTVCFDIKVPNPLADGYAPLLIIDNAGQKQIFELRYKRYVVDFDPLLTSGKFMYDTTAVGKKMGKTWNFVLPLYAERPVTITSIGFKHPTNSFFIVNTSDTLPRTLTAGDDYWFNILFSPKNVGFVFDTLVITTDCFTYSVPIEGTGALGGIYATDYTFDDTFVGQVKGAPKPYPINVKNVGNFPFTIIDMFFEGDTNVFKFNIGGNDGPVVCPHVLRHDRYPSLPIVTLYIPRKVGYDSARIIFKTSIPEPFIFSMKDTMHLYGRGIAANSVQEHTLEEFSLHPNPVYGQDATLSFTLNEPKQLSIAIYDILGREVITLPSQYYSSGSYSNSISTVKLNDGSYILRVSDGVHTRSISFRVVK